mmetsp:Transcript_10810/g.28761  ORF Transcript_10810/g.28761 Transcript_10810/m.28761 type:complete len:375 (-) Transcript_10810:512-1636(-)
MRASIPLKKFLSYSNSFIASTNSLSGVLPVKCWWKSFFLSLRKVIVLSDAPKALSTALLKSCKVFNLCLNLSCDCLLSYKANWIRCFSLSVSDFCSSKISRVFMLASMYFRISASFSCNFLRSAVPFFISNILRESSSCLWFSCVLCCITTLSCSRVCSCRTSMLCRLFSSMTLSWSAVTTSRSNMPMEIWRSCTSSVSPAFAVVCSRCFFSMCSAKSVLAFAIASCNCRIDSFMSSTASSSGMSFPQHSFPMTRQPVSMMEILATGPAPFGSALRKLLRVKNFSRLKTDHGRFLGTVFADFPPAPAVGVSMNLSEISPHCHIWEPSEEATELLPPALMAMMGSSAPSCMPPSSWPALPPLPAWHTRSGATLSR